jgi:hypothetical protein
MLALSLAAAAAGETCRVLIVVRSPEAHPLARRYAEIVLDNRTAVDIVLSSRFYCLGQYFDVDARDAAGRRLTPEWYGASGLPPFERPMKEATFSKKAATRTDLYLFYGFNGFDGDPPKAGRYTVRVRFQCDGHDATSAPHHFTLTPAHVANPPRLTHVPGFGDIYEDLPPVEYTPPAP